MAKRSKKKEAEKKPDEFKVNPFSSLKMDLPEGPPPTPPPPKPVEKPKRDSDGWPEEFLISPLVMRIEKKGRGGKTVTAIQGFDVGYELEMQELAGQLRTLLGTGGTVREDVLELQGDQRYKAASWLRQQGFRVKGDIS